MPTASWQPQPLLSTRRLELNGLQRLLVATLPRRVVVAGGPQSGKTTLAKALARETEYPHRGSDELIGLGWSESSLAASLWFNESGPWICEGVAMPRALRKWLARNPEGSPADLIVWINQPAAKRSPGQAAMAAGCATVWNEILPQVLRRETRVISL